MKTTRTTCLAWCLGLLCWTSAPYAADVAILTQVCRECHGEKGLSQYPHVPVLAGQVYTLIEDNLLAFRAKQRPCMITPFMQGDTSRDPTSMCEIAGGLSDDEIAALAAHYSGLEFVPRKQDFDPGRIEAGRAVHAKSGCAQCHGESGRKTSGLACRLAGQWTTYLAKAFGEIRAGERYAPDIMREAIRSLSDEDVADLLHFYASQQDW